MVAAADKIHNLTSLYEVVLETGEIPFGTKFKSREESEWFYRRVYEVIEKRLENKILLMEFKRVMDLVFINA
jgi:RNAse (barnase) inhibitor barstar